MLLQRDLSLEFQYLRTQHFTYTYCRHRPMKSRWLSKLVSWYALSDCQQRHLGVLNTISRLSLHFCANSVVGLG